MFHRPRTAIDGNVDIASQYDASTSGLFGKLGMRFDWGSAAIEPFAAFSHTRHNTDGFDENAGGALMPVAEHSTSTSSLEVGVDAFGAELFTSALRGNLMLAASFPTQDAEVVAVQSIGVSSKSSKSASIRGIPSSGKGWHLKAGLSYQASENTLMNISYAHARIGSDKDKKTRKSLEYKFAYNF